MRWRTLREILAVIVLSLLFVTVGTATGGDPALYPPAAGAAQTIFLVDNGLHSDVAVPRAAIMAHGGPLAQATAKASADPWILVGWGDAKFYEATDPWEGRILDGLRALIGGRATVVHLQGIDRSPDKAWNTGVQPIPVSPAGLAALLARADQAFAQSADGAPIFAPSQRAPGEAFFKSSEGFGLFHLCNHWTAGLLAAAGLPMTPVLDTLPAGLWFDLKLRSDL
jgi:uncharacterized protein (TIGR02117 family)